MARLNLQGNPDDSNARAALSLLDTARTIRAPSRGYFQLRSRCLTMLGESDDAQRDAEQSERPDLGVSAEDQFLAGEMLRLQDAGSSADAIRDERGPRRELLAQAIDKYRAALRLNPRHYWAQYQLGRCLLALGRGPEAVEALAVCVAMRPDSSWAYTSRGLANALSGRSDEALIDLNRAVRLDPDFQPARLNRGVVHWLRDETEAATADFTAVLAAAPDKRLVEAAYYRAQLLLKTGRAREALADVSTVIDSRADFRSAYWLRAQARFRLGSYDDGEEDLVRFLALGRQSPQGKPGLDPHVRLGKALRLLALELDSAAKTQALVRSCRELEAAIADDPLAAEAFEHLGAAQESLGKFPEAIASYSQGLALEASRVPLLNLRGWAYAATQQFDLARADFAEALRQEPDNPESHTGLGFAMAEGGAIDDAHMQALSATLLGADNYLVLHNVACIYGRLSKSAKANRIECEDMALAVLRRAVALSRQNSAGGPDEVALIRQETAFSDSLRARPEFQRLLFGQASKDP
jgi:tetratricopeptide (TPR) repeat protein